MRPPVPAKVSAQQKVNDAVARHALLPLLVVIALIGSSTVLLAQRGPNNNERYPIKSGAELSPPLVWPVGECAKAVHVSGFIPHAIVRVFVNTTTQVGIANPYFSETDISVSPPLKLGDIVTATQGVLGFTSSQSHDPVTVPTGDETYTPDHYGRISRFQHGEIVWSPNKRAHARYFESKEREEEEREEDDRN